MCGLTGYWRPHNPSPEESLPQTAARMAVALRYRGPDEAGTWADVAAGLALGHCRLAIVDLSPAGHQPMASANGRFVTAFNGEIYNHLELRAAPQGLGAEPVWRGHSDTEILLARFDHWGVEATLQRSVGMFAMAVWDEQSHTLVLARDRFGEKPIYDGWAGDGDERALVFGSELKILQTYPDFDAQVCREALAQYLRFIYVPAPRSIYQGNYKLEPGCLLKVQGPPPVDAPAQPLRPGHAYGSVSLQRWWSITGAVQAGASELLVSEAQAIGMLEQQLSEAVSLQSLADVPLGAFLSGGSDSSTIVALRQRQSARPLKSFTIGFDEARFDESPHALAVARHLGTEHHEMRVTAQMAQDVIPNLLHMYDEPFSDSSQIPTHMVCKAARQHVTVALSDDAGDELFGGYNRYFWGPKVWKRWLGCPCRCDRPWER